jgi:hypothetical protein
MADQVLWRKTMSLSGNQLAADADGDGTVDLDDYNVWRSRFGTTVSAGSGGSFGEEAPVPEPVADAAALTALAIAALWHKRANR